MRVPSFDRKSGRARDGVIRNRSKGLLSLVLITVLLLVGCGGGEGPGDYPQEEVNRVIAIQDRYTDSLLTVSNINGVGTTVGEDGVVSILITLEQEIETDIPESLDGVPVVVEVVGEIVPFECVEKHRPIHIGTSISDIDSDCHSGTFGCVVIRDGEQFILTNNHVIAGVNRVPLGTPVVQPSLGDALPPCLVNPAEIVATLTDFEPISGTEVNYIDAAIAKLSLPDDEISCSTIPSHYGTPGSTVVEARVGMRVMKAGRTTCLTRGQVIAVNYAGKVNYNGRQATFKKQIRVSRGFSKAGDSGSLVVTDDGKHNPVGLLFAGSEGGPTVVNPIGLVLERFDVIICSGQDMDSLRQAVGQVDEAGPPPDLEAEYKRRMDSVLGSLSSLGGSRGEKWKMRLVNFKRENNPYIDGDLDFGFLLNKTWDCEVEGKLGQEDEVDFVIKDYFVRDKGFLGQDLTIICQRRGSVIERTSPDIGAHRLDLELDLRGFLAFELSIEFSSDRQTGVGKLVLKEHAPGMIVPSGYYSLIGSCEMRLTRVE